MNARFLIEPTGLDAFSLRPVPMLRRGLAHFFTDGPAFLQWVAVPRAAAAP